jgi:hypothetical protein
MRLFHPIRSFLPAIAVLAAFAADAAEDPIKPLSVPTPDFADDGGDYRSPLVFEDGRRVESADQWPERRAEILERWTSLLGEWPPLVSDPGLEYLESEAMEGYARHRVRFLWTPEERTTGYLLVPEVSGATDEPGSGERLPAVLTVFYEPETAVGLGRENRDFALQLTKRGFVTLSIGTAEATAERTYSLYWPSIDAAEVQPLSMLACAAANAWQVLAAHPRVDPERIGITGHSFGGKWAMFASCLHEGFAAAAWSDPGIVFDTRPSVNYWEPWYLGYHPRPWRERGVPTEENPARGLYPELLAQGRDLHELHALMAPRPFFVSGGSEDPPERWRALHHSIEVNRLLGHDGRVAMHNRPLHEPNEESNELIYRFFERELMGR